MLNCIQRKLEDLYMTSVPFLFKHNSIEVISKLFISKNRNISVSSLRGEQQDWRSNILIHYEISSQLEIVIRKICYLSNLQPT